VIVFTAALVNLLLATFKLINFLLVNNNLVKLKIPISLNELQLKFK